MPLALLVYPSEDEVYQLIFLFPLRPYFFFQKRLTDYTTTKGEKQRAWILSPSSNLPQASGSACAQVLLFSTRESVFTMQNYRVFVPYYRMDFRQQFFPHSAAAAAVPYSHDRARQCSGSGRKGVALWGGTGATLSAGSTKGSEQQREKSRKKRPDEISRAMIVYSATRL